MLRKLDLSHADVGSDVGSDEEFSLYWTGMSHLFKKDYPEWINMCQRAFVAFERGNFMTVPTELAREFGLSEESSMVNVSDGSYRQFGDIPRDAQKKVIARDKKNIQKEQTLWALSSVRNLIAQYIAFKLYQNKVQFENTDIFLLKQKLVDEFAKSLVNSVINKVFVSGAYWVQYYQFEKFEKEVTDDFKFLLINRDNKNILERLAFSNDSIAKVKASPGLIQDTAPVPTAATSATIAAGTASASTADAAPVLTIDEVESSTTAETVCTPAADAASAPIADTARVTISDAVPAPTADAAPAPTSAVPVAPPTSTSSQSRLVKLAATVALLSIGAAIGLLALGVVVIATHGVAVPFIVGVGTAILLGHGGATAGFALGLGLFSAASATVGAVASYTASKVGQFISNCFCGRDKAAAEAHTSTPSRVDSSTGLMNKSINSDRPRTSYGAIPKPSPSVPKQPWWKCVGFFAKTTTPATPATTSPAPDCRQRLGHLL